MATGNTGDNEEGPAFDTGGSGAAGRSALRERCGSLNISPMHLVTGKLKRRSSSEVGTAVSWLFRPLLDRGAGTVELVMAGPKVALRESLSEVQREVRD